MNAKIGFAVLFWLISLHKSPAQAFTYFQTAGGSGEEGFTCMATGPNEIRYVTGTYNQPFQWNGISLPLPANDDVFLARLGPEGLPEWVLSGGSADVDDATAVAVTTTGLAFWGGIFWDTIQLDSWTGVAPAGGKALFILSVTPSGDPGWGAVLSGAGAKGLRELLTDSDDNLYAIGYFGGQLSIGDTLLQAQGDLSGFVAKWNAGGDFQWALRFGDSGSVRGECLAIRHTAQLYLGGRFNGSISLAGATIQSNTLDDDGFVAAVSATTGEALWLRKAGAQYDDVVNALAVNTSNKLFATGTFVGVLQVDEGWTIQTAGFNTNFFLIRYNALDGTPEWAQSLGNSTDEQGLSIGIRNEGPVVAGLFRSALTLEGQTITGLGEGFNGFAAGFRSEGGLRWLVGFPGDDLVIPEQIEVDEEGAVWVVGGFSGEAWFNGSPISSNGVFDAWIGKLDETVTATLEGSLLSLPGLVFPNPVSECLFLENFSFPVSFRLFRIDGVLAQQGESMSGQIDIHHLPPGLYFLQIWIPETGVFRTFPVQKI
ncbi:MAG: T9SS type A sorting domain-containing protein [Saprospirales bacterium]|nr:T9SS type A sorting domain-containing protein [Saprospirales bacterium]